MNTELERLTTDLATRAAGLTVTDQATANQATELILAGKDMIKKIKVFFTPLKDAARTSWQGIVNTEKTELEKIEPIMNTLSRGLSSWRADEERKRHEAEMRRTMAEEERRRLEEEALRKVKEAEEQAEGERKRLEEEAEKLRQEAAKTDNEAAMKRIEEGRERIRQEAEENRRRVEEATDKAIDEAAKAEAAMAPAPVVPDAPKTSGLSMQDHWCFEVVDPMAVPREFLAIDEVKIGKVVRAIKGQITIPGVRIFNLPIMASIGNRTKI